MTGFGYDRDHTIVKARREGLKFVLYKPFRLDQLVSAIEHTIEERQQQVPSEATLASDE
jgi:DNA-binding NtrC family response regulator